MNDSEVDLQRNHWLVWEYKEETNCFCRVKVTFYLRQRGGRY